MAVTDRKKILTIDDEDALRRSIMMFFEDEGFAVFEADNGRDGLEVFHRHQPDVVLVDLRMPEMDGLEVIRVLAKDAPDIPVIVVSGTGMLEDAIEAIRAGACDYITKPVIDMLVLEHTVRKALEKAELVAENRMYQEHLEELVAERTAELHQAQKIEAIGTLAGGIAHDFNNILTGIIGFNELALMMCRDDKIKGYMEEIEKAANRAKVMVQQILTFSRKGDQKALPLQVDLIVREVCKLIRSSIPSSILIKTDISTTASVLADPSQFHQVMMNLCTNAYQSMVDGEGEIGVSLHEVTVRDGESMVGLDLEPGRYIQLQVSDTGCGMDRTTLERVFDPFFTTKETGSGTGLGLSVVHGIVNSYGGSILGYSEPGQGTTFHVFLPVLSKEAVRPEPRAAARGNSDLTGSERILFVDDEQAIVDLAQGFFSSCGYVISCFTDSLQALDAFTAHPDDFDVVITDMTMPKMNGEKFAKAVMEINGEIPVILCTGFSEVLSREKTLAMGISEFVQKPVPMSEMVRIVRTVLV